jgi:hypothetical protein
MAERYTEISLDEMESFIKESYRALHPKKGRKGAEVIFDLSLSDNHSIFVRVYTSIYEGSGQGRNKGSDSIKVVMLSDKGQALMPPAKIVMRTKNWRSAVEDRVEEYLEVYESKVAYWKERRLKLDGQDTKREDALDKAIEQSLPELTQREKQQLEDAEAEIRQEEENSREEPRLPGPKKTKPGAAFEGSYRSVGPNEWGIQIFTKDLDSPLVPGLEGKGVTKGGQSRKIRLVERVKTFKDVLKGPGELWKFEDVNGAARQQGYGGGGGGGYGGYRRYGSDPLAESVAKRYLTP